MPRDDYCYRITLNGIRPRSMNRRRCLLNMGHFLTTATLLGVLPPAWARGTAGAADEQAAIYSAGKGPGLQEIAAFVDMGYGWFGIFTERHDNRIDGLRRLLLELGQRGLQFLIFLVPIPV